MKDDDEFLFDLGECQHTPIRMPRPGVVGEHVFLKNWQALMAQPSPYPDDQSNYALNKILSSFPFTLTQRHATVAASFVTWLGTNCGRAMLSDCERLLESSRIGEDAYLAGWAIDNHRKSYVNGGFTVIEAILAPDDHYGTDKFNLGQLVRAPEIPPEEYELINHVAYWLGSTDGRQFVAKCEREIKRILDAESEERFHKWKHEHGNKRIANLLNEADPA